MSSNINSTIKLVDGLFPHTKLTKIIGKPKYKTIKIIQKEITANACSVPSTLSDGTMGHFGLIHNASTVAIHAPNHPYVRPVQPVVPNYTGTAAQIAAMKDTFDESLRDFKDVNLIQATLKR